MPSDGSPNGAAEKLSFGLRQALLLLLTAALLPAGGLVIAQTYNAYAEAKQLRERELLQEVVEAIEAPRNLVGEARAALNLASIQALEYMADRDTCTAKLKQLAGANPRFLAAHLVNREGMLACSSTGATEPVDLSDSTNFREIKENPHPIINIIQGRVTQREVVLVVEPVLENGEFAGAVSISIPVDQFDHLAKATDSSNSQRFALMGPRGEVFAFDLGDTNWLPLPSEIERLTQFRPNQIRSTSRGGEEFLYASISMVDDELTTIAGWPTEEISFELEFDAAIGMALPVVAWVMALLVVYLAADMLVLRHMAHLGALHRRLRRGDLTARSNMDPLASTEFLEFGRQFDTMAERIAEREARLHRSLAEERMLIREVHHRVKNNLQLIVSLLNLQLQETDDRSEQALLRRTQDRVQSLAVVHQNLYQVGKLTEVRLDQVLEQILSSISSIRGNEFGSVDVRVDVDPVRVDADRAVPTCLLATEALNNAFKHAWAPDEHGELSLELSDRGEGAYHIRISNSLRSGGEDVSDSTDRSGLGKRLMEGFARQLRARMTSGHEGERFIVVVEIPSPPPRFDPARDAPEQGSGQVGPSPGAETRTPAGAG